MTACPICSDYFLTQDDPSRPWESCPDYLAAVTSCQVDGCMPVDQGLTPCQVAAACDVAAGIAVEHGVAIVVLGRSADGHLQMRPVDDEDTHVEGTYRVAPTQVDGKVTVFDGSFIWDLVVPEPVETVPCSKARVLVPTLALSLPVREMACQEAADIALYCGLTVTVVGWTGDRIRLCTDGDDCCARLPGVLSVVPDVDAISRWGMEVPSSGMRMEREDGRTAYVFQGAAR